MMKYKRYKMREAAKELGVTRQTLYYRFKKGWLSQSEIIAIFRCLPRMI